MIESSNFIYVYYLCDCTYGQLDSYGVSPVKQFRWIVFMRMEKCLLLEYIRACLQTSYELFNKRV